LAISLWNCQPLFIKKGGIAMIGKVFKFSIPEGIMVLVPEAGKLFLMEPNKAGRIPEYVLCEPIAQPNRGLLTSTSLVLTQKCNMRCVYCYEQAGNYCQSITSDIIDAAIELVVRNSLLFGVKTPRLNLFGGEPTLAWNELKYAIRRFKEKCQFHGLDGRITLITNGIVSLSRLSSILNDLTFVSLSFDGPPDINDFQRVLPSGKSSTKIIVKTASFLLREKGSRFFAIRATILPENVTLLPKIHSYFSEIIPGVLVRYEPVFLSGRARQDGRKGIGLDIEIFGKNLLSCLNLKNSNPFRNSFLTVFVMSPGAFFSSCGINMHVLPSGDVVSCYRNNFGSDPKKSPFYIGKFNPFSGLMEINQERLLRLRNLHVDKIPACKDCFARYSCRGGCPAVKSSMGLDPWKDSFIDCEKIKKVTVELLRRKLVGQNRS